MREPTPTPGGWTAEPNRAGQPRVVAKAGERAVSRGGTRGFRGAGGMQMAWPALWPVAACCGPWQAAAARGGLVRFTEAPVGCRHRGASARRPERGEAAKNREMPLNHFGIYFFDVHSRTEISLGRLTKRTPTHTPVPPNHCPKPGRPEPSAVSLQ